MIGLGLGLHLTKAAGGGIVQKLASRVSKEGGTFEAKACLKEELARIEAI